jgi:hypothetical protein
MSPHNQALFTAGEALRTGQWITLFDANCVRACSKTVACGFVIHDALAGTTVKIYITDRTRLEALRRRFNPA